MKISEKHLGCICNVKIDGFLETGLIVSTDKKTGIIVYVFDRFSLVTVKSRQITNVNEHWLTSNDVEEYLLLRVW